MRRVVACLCFVLVGVSACGDDPGVCQQACERVKKCSAARLAALDCDDPTNTSTCDGLRQAAEADCSAAGDACTGDEAAMAERTVKCELDPKTCACPPNPCIDACLKQKDCAKVSLDMINCANNAATCDELKQMLNKDCYAFTDANCTGALRDAADKINSCYLNRSTCMCMR